VGYVERTPFKHERADVAIVKFSPKHHEAAD